jgi:hypothetical protein
MFSNKNSFWLRNAEFLADISQPIFLSNGAKGCSDEGFQSLEAFGNLPQLHLTHNQFLI